MAAGQTNSTDTNLGFLQITLFQKDFSCLTLEYFFGTEESLQRFLILFKSYTKVPSGTRLDPV